MKFYPPFYKIFSATPPLLFFPSCFVPPPLPILTLPTSAKDNTAPLSRKYLAKSKKSRPLRTHTHELSPSLPLFLSSTPVPPHAFSSIYPSRFFVCPRDTGVGEKKKRGRTPIAAEAKAKIPPPSPLYFSSPLLFFSFGRSRRSAQQPRSPSCSS